MHRSIGAVVMAFLLVTSGVAFGFAGTVGAQSESADATISQQTSGGTTVVVDEVTVPDGGFVTIHDSTVLDGGEAVLTSVRGSSSYLGPGTHQNVTVTLDDPIAEDDTLVAMPHRDTNGDRIYSFVSSGASADGPYTADGEAVVDTANVTVSATVTMSDQPTDGSSVLVDRVELSEPGFVTIHDSSLLDSATFDSIRGTSAYLEAGVHENVRVELDEELQNEDTLIPMAHKDTNDNQAYDFAASDGESDGPFLDDQGEAVVDTAAVTPTDETTVSMNDTATSGHYVNVDEVFLSEGGFVTIHDSTVLDGDVFESIRGTSDYLEPGLHKNVGVHLDEPLEEGDTVVPMAHRDTNDNQEYDFADSEGENDGPYLTDDDNAVVDTANATISAQVSMDDARVDGNTVVVDRVDLAEGGFVTIHDSSLFAGETLGSVRGTSAYLEAGHHHDVEIQLDEPLTESQTVVPMAHRDTNDNQQYDFVDSEAAEDGPYTYQGNAVVDTARMSVLSQVSFSSQENVEDTVTVDSVTLHNGGFVTVHDSTVLDGDVFDSVRGTSEYLGPGTHEDVEVEVDEVPGGEDTFVAMPHRDTNDNQQYDFVDSEAAEDAPYVAGGGAVVNAANVSATRTAEVSISDQTTDGSTVTVDSASLSHGGFVTIHDGSVLDGSVFDSVRGSSEYLEPGDHSDIEVTLDDPYEEDGTAIAMPHLDTNDNEGYDFVDSEGEADGPYTADGEAVVDDASLTVESDDGMDENGMGGGDDTDTEDTSDGDGAGFGVVVALLAIIGSVFAARRLN
jgi:PGF-CTERM protein